MVEAKVALFVIAILVFFPVGWPIRVELFWNQLAGVADRGRIDRRQCGVGHGHEQEPDHGCRRRRGHHKGRHFFHADGNADPGGARFNWRGDGAGGEQANDMLAYVGMIIGIAALGLVVYLFLRLGGPLVERLGPNATGSINRIFGFLILAVAVQLIWDGISDFRR